MGGSDFQCAQAFVALTDQGPNTGGLVVLPGSHRVHQKIFAAGGAVVPATAHTDFMHVPPDHEALCGCVPSLVCCQQGDVVLWDSRLVHCNFAAWHPFDDTPIDGLGLPADVSDFCMAAGLRTVAEVL